MMFDNYRRHLKKFEIELAETKIKTLYIFCCFFNGKKNSLINKVKIITQIFAVKYKIA